MVILPHSLHVCLALIFFLSPAALLPVKNSHMLSILTIGTFGAHTGYRVMPQYVPGSVSYFIHFLLTLLKGQYVDGLRMPLVIQNRCPGGEVFGDKYNNEFTVVLRDWLVYFPFLIYHYLSLFPCYNQLVAFLQNTQPFIPSRYHTEHAILLKQYISMANPNSKEPTPSEHPCASELALG
jgi:hypothetical protein